MTLGLPSFLCSTFSLGCLIFSILLLLIFLNLRPIARFFASFKNNSKSLLPPVGTHLLHTLSSHSSPFLIAHRLFDDPSRDDVLENTVEGLRESVVVRGVPAVEFDVQLTRDGELVLYHDTSDGGLGRLCDLSELGLDDGSESREDCIAVYSLDEIKRMKFKRNPRLRIPTMDELADEVEAIEQERRSSGTQERVLLFMDVKIYKTEPTEMADAIVEFFRRRPGFLETIIVLTDSSAFLLLMRERASQSHLPIRLGRLHIRRPYTKALRESLYKDKIDDQGIADFICGGSLFLLSIIRHLTPLFDYLNELKLFNVVHPRVQLECVFLGVVHESKVEVEECELAFCGEDGRVGLGGESLRGVRVVCWTMGFDSLGKGVAKKLEEAGADGFVCH